ncbi:hypothetical protein [Nocardioides alkalitolerans]|uniref:hypothetical protein n=1 Tax=Nocardioides alkalitolerans TaxID=281714 RepID=UPI0012FA4719|nr:hypothetical protein [Nocardioides alkalitolerans]
MGARSGLDPDTAAVISLHATALRLVRDHQTRAEVVEQLRRLAGGGRRDLVGNAAGFLLGAYLASPGTSDPAMIDAAAALLATGADPEAVREGAEGVRARLIGGHTNPR